MVTKRKSEKEDERGKKLNGGQCKVAERESEEQKEKKKKIICKKILSNMHNIHGVHTLCESVKCVEMTQLNFT